MMGKEKTEIPEGRGSSQTPLEWKFRVDGGLQRKNLPWGKYGYFLELHNVTHTVHSLTYCLLSQVCNASKGLIATNSVCAQQLKSAMCNVPSESTSALCHNITRETLRGHHLIMVGWYACFNDPLSYMYSPVYIALSLTPTLYSWHCHPCQVR